MQISNVKCFLNSGPYGINHGVELHADVVKYGLERLEDFKKNSPAIDAFSFCDPQFVQGDCYQELWCSLQVLNIQLHHHPESEVPSPCVRNKHV